MNRFLVAALVYFALAALTASAYCEEWAVEGGIGRTWNLGEQSPFFVASTDYLTGPIQVEGLYSSANKYTGQGWIVRAAGDVWFQDLSVGAAWTHRNGGPWSKDVWWFRAGARAGMLRLIGEVAPSSRNMEAKVEARVRIRYGWFLIEPRYFVEWHSQAEDSYAQGLSILVGGVIR